MRNRRVAAAFLFLSCLACAQYRDALPGYQYTFPRDHFAHPEFQTEWWYYTGNLRAADGHRFGFELTFFRQGLDRRQPKESSWTLDDLYFAHLALSDLDAQKFDHVERTNRAGPGIAGAYQLSGTIWNGNWQVQIQGSRQLLKAVSDDFSIELTLETTKPPVIHGQNGISQKAEGRGRASHYISLTRLVTSGNIEVGSKRFETTGFSWMDHEFFTHQLSADQTGWDWLSLQLADNTELMLFRIRHKDGSLDPYSAGTYVDSAGKSFHLRRSDFMLQPVGQTWNSAATKAMYPVHWRISVPSLGIEGEITTSLANQEITGHNRIVPSYWEGAIVFQGERQHARTAGSGYLEMTGYDRAIELGR